MIIYLLPSLVLLFAKPVAEMDRTPRTARLVLILTDTGLDYETSMISPTFYCHYDLLSDGDITGEYVSDQNKYPIMPSRTNTIL